MRQDQDEELFEVIEHDANVDRVSEAMRAFLARGDTASFERSVAVFVRSARARHEPVEIVLAALESLVDAVEASGVPGFDRRNTPLRHLVLRGVLLAFYGAEVVQREADARQERVERRAQSPTPAPGGERQ